MNSLTRVFCVSNRVVSAQPRACFDAICDCLDRAAGSCADIVLFPQLALSSAGCGTLFKSPLILDLCREQLDHIRLRSRDMNAFIVIGLVIDDGGEPVSACAVLHRGQLLGFVPAASFPAAPYLKPAAPGMAPPDGFGQMLPSDTVFASGGLSFCVVPSSLEDFARDAYAAAQTGCDLILFPSLTPVTAGRIDTFRQEVATVSRSLGIGVAAVNGGLGESSSPYLYRSFAVVSECGETLSFALQSGPDADCCQSCADVDSDVIRSRKRHRLTASPFFSASKAVNKPGLLRMLRTNPFLPERNADRYLGELFSLQVDALAARMSNTGIQKLVLGVSGGLDSTLAALVAAKALDSLGLPRHNLIGITLPGFGTSDRTYYNALSMLETLEADSRDISIRAAVLQHFEDIGQDPAHHDVTYENAQARERAQILLDLSNKERALAVGTGDLSEAALGWSTFAGDQIASYNVNICLTKTMVRQVVGYVARKELLPGLSEVLGDILDTPVSPELLPPEENGEIRQKTEDILGPYELHDFFLYYLINYQFRPTKMYHYACRAFAGVLEPEFILDKLKLFFRRFFAGQFKRSCAPDTAAITDVNLCGVQFYIPSDAAADAFLEELEALSPQENSPDGEQAKGEQSQAH